MTINPTAKATAVNDWRMKFLRAEYGATDHESDDSVPSDARADFDQHVEFNRQYAERWFENGCKWYGSASGDWAGVPEKNQADALAYFAAGIAEHENRTHLEYDVAVIDAAEAAALALDEELA